MGRRNEQKDKLLQRLRRENPIYGKKVINIVNSIKNEELCKDPIQNNCAERIKLLRELHRLSKRELGSILEVSHVMINHLECLPGGKDYRPINKYFLEAFSHVFYVSPYFLIGKTDMFWDYDGNGLIEPFMDTFPELDRLSTRIVNALYAGQGIEFQLNQRLLRCFIRICCAKYEHRNLMKRNLSDAPAIQGLAKLELITENNPPLQVPDKDYLTSLFCKEIFYSFGIRDLSFLNLMISIANAPITIKELVCNWLELGGFLTKPRAFVRIEQTEEVTKKIEKGELCNNLLIIDGSKVPVPNYAYFFRDEHPGSFSEAKTLLEQEQRNKTK